MNSEFYNNLSEQDGTEYMIRAHLVNSISCVQSLRRYWRLRGCVHKTCTLL